MPYTSNHRGVTGFVIVEPDGDRPYFCHKIPLEYMSQASTRGARVFHFSLSLRGGAPLVMEVNLSRAKIVADLLDACSRQAGEPHVEAAIEEVKPGDLTALALRRDENLRIAAERCLVVEKIDRVLFAMQEGGKKGA